MSNMKSYYNRGTSIFLEENGFTFDNNDYRLFNYFKTLCLNRFKWDNLPHGLESRHIEQALFLGGQCLFFIDKEDVAQKFICLPCAESFQTNIYGDPLGFIVNGANGFSKTIKKDEGVRIIDNDTLVPPVFHILHYVELIGEIERTIRMNLKQQKFPFIAPMSKENELSMRTLLSQLDGFKECILVDETLSESLKSGKNGEGIKVLNTGVPFLLEQLSDFKLRTYNELYTFLGLNNTNVAKKERMLVDEINSNNTVVQLILDSGFKNRELARDIINQTYGLNITVEKVINNLDVDFQGQVKENLKEGE